MDLILKHVVEETSDGRTVHFVLKNKMNLSERLIKKMKYNGNILCNAAPVYVNKVVRAGDLVEVYVSYEEAPSGIIPEEIPLDILYEDDGLIAINKPPFMVVHPAGKHQCGTLANGVLFHLQKQDINSIIRPVSRLDRDTSGIILFAKNPFVQESLIRQMGSTFHKEYTGVVHGTPNEDTGTIDYCIERKPGSIIERQVSSGGLRSVTHFKVLERLNGASVLQFILETGRTHQIRVHCQAIGHPLVGDTLYFNAEIQNKMIQENVPVHRQALHSARVVFIHPADGKQTEICAPLAADMKELISLLSIQAEVYRQPWQ